jgi:hypothetical protein
MHIGYLSEDYEDRANGKTKTIWVDNIKIDVRLDVVKWSGLIWLSIRCSGEILYRRKANPATSRGGAYVSSVRYEQALDASRVVRY